MSRIKIVEPPAVAIDWVMLTDNLRSEFKSRYRMQKEIPGLAASTANALWNGKSVGLIPFMRACIALGHDPFVYWMER